MSEVVEQIEPPAPAELSPARAALAKVESVLGKAYLGTREDRGELTAWVELSSWVQASEVLRNQTPFNLLSDLMAVDYLDRDPRFDLSIIVTSHEHHTFVRIKTMVDGEICSAPTLVKVWPGANWYEREVFDLFGINFERHPSLRRLLLPADYHGHPLRKDYPVTGPATSAFR